MKKFLSILMVVVMASFLLVGCLPTPNVGPVFTSTAGTTATVGTAYSYTPTATDADGDTVTFAVAGPTGMAISAGVITWTPATADIGAHSVIVTASDGTNATAQTFTLTVSAAVVPVPVGTVISIPALVGVTAPVYGATPVTAITASTQYTGTVAWKTAAGVAVGTTFAASTVYVATITLTPATGFTLTGVTANFFTVAAAAGTSNPADSGVATATFATTGVGGTVVSIKAIPGIAAPVYGATPDTAITATTQYTGTIAWKTAAGVAVGTTFAANTVYVATVTLIPVAGFTFTGVTANFFTNTVGGEEGISNPADSGVVTVSYAVTNTTPAVVSAVFSDSDTITITYNVAVDTVLTDYSDIKMVYPGTSTLTRNQISGGGTKYISITFTSSSGVYATNTTTGTLDIAATVCADADNNIKLVALDDQVIAAGGF